MIHTLKKLGSVGRWKFGVVSYAATDWCLWPVLVFNPAPKQRHVRMLSLQVFNVGLGVAWTRRGEPLHPTQPVEACEGMP